MTHAPDINAYIARMGERGASSTVVTEIVREYQGDVGTHLRDLIGERASGQRLNETHSDFMDRLIRRLFEFAEEDFFSMGGEAETDFCVVAVGGYARREMSIHSDVDLLFVYRDTITPHVSAVAQRVQTWLWDARLTVGGATRTIAETISLARNDATVQTAVLAPRYLAGSGVLFHEFTEALDTKLFSNPRKSLAGLTEAMRERHARFGDSLYLLQPNLKEGAGGLRDYQTSYWAMQLVQPGARGIEDFVYLGLLKEEELNEYLAALDFLWRVRNQLHLLSGRKNDQLSFELQEQAGAAMGYGNGANEGTDLPVERFMGDYYRHARAVLNYSSLVCEHCGSRLRGVPRRRRIKEVEDGFRISEGKLEIPHTRMLRERPLRMLTAFAVAQENDVTLTRKAQQLIRENLDVIDDAFQRDPESKKVFERILSADHRVTRTLMAMNETSVLARYLPEWEHIVYRWQHVMYHTYTVDVHSIFLVEELRRLWRKKYESALPELTHLIHEVEDLTVLFLGCLLHDIGKGFGGDHSNRGAVRARVTVERLGLDADRVDRVVFLVQHHLLMSHLAQSRDLSDPKLILDFARLVGDRRNLRDLYLLTFADIRASSTEAWTDWKGQLLRDLYESTSEFLESGSDDPSKTIEQIEKRVATRRDSAAADLKNLGVSEVMIDSYFEMMPHRYYTAHSPRQIARHAMAVMGLTSDRVLSIAVREMRGDFSEFILVSKDRPGLYADVAGVMTAHNMNILGAHVYTTRSGVALEVYRLTTPRGGDDERRMAWKELEGSLEEVLRDQIEVAELLRRRGRPIGIEVSPSQKPAFATISNDESDFYTIADVKANDRLGLLHDLTRVIAANGFEIYISKAATVLDQVQDTFYLKDRNGKKLHDAAVIEALRLDLLKAAQGTEAGGGD